MIWETARLAATSLRRNPLRSSLTVLGIIIGVAAVIALISIGQGTTVRVTEEIGKLGSNILQLRPGQAQAGLGGVKTSARAFDLADADAIRTQILGLKSVSPVAQKSMTVIANAINWSTQVVGTDNDYFPAQNWTLSAGRLFLDSELRAGTSTCILGDALRAKLFGSADAIGQTLRLKTFSCEIAGTLAPKGNSSFGQDEDDKVVIPLRTLQRRIAGNREVNQILIVAADDVATEKIQHQVTQLMRERRRITPGSDDDFSVLDVKQVMSTITGVIGLLTGLLSAVAAVSLIVGGIGIMNIMLVSVTERTREVGIRLAIGAVQSQVLGQFLVEAIVLSLFGGAMGIVIGIALILIAQQTLAIPFMLDVSTVIMAFGFCGLVGIVFGYVPARRAANLDPIDALRRE